MRCTPGSTSCFCRLPRTGLWRLISLTSSAISRPRGPHHGATARPHRHDGDRHSRRLTRHSEDRSDAGGSPQDTGGYATGQFDHLGDRNEFLPTVHGFDEWFGNLYHSIVSIRRRPQVRPPARCAHARSKGLTKDNCLFICRGGAGWAAASHARQPVLPGAERRPEAISPQPGFREFACRLSMAMVAVTRFYDAVLSGRQRRVAASASSRAIACVF